MQPRDRAGATRCSPKIGSPTGAFHGKFTKRGPCSDLWLVNRNMFLHPWFLLCCVGALALGLIVNRPSAATSLSFQDGIPAGIVWYGVLTDGLAEAQRTHKPVLLVSAAPQCIGVSGMW